VKISRIIAAAALSGFVIISLSVPVSANAESVIVKTITTAPGISIDTSLYLPSDTPAPAILIAHGFGGTKDSVESDAKYFRDKGFAVLTWTARGFGKINWSD
jgi:ABC-2 type transport system ATP-binding protein